MRGAEGLGVDVEALRSRQLDGRAEPGGGIEPARPLGQVGMLAHGGEEAERGPDVGGHAVSITLSGVGARRVTMRSDVLWQQVEGSVVMIHVDRDRCFRLNGVGSRMWELLDEHGDTDAVRERLAGEFDVGSERLAGELDAFVAQLAAAGLVTVDPPAE
jgi:hypothetical protein